MRVGGFSLALCSRTPLVVHASPDTDKHSPITLLSCDAFYESRIFVHHVNEINTHKLIPGTPSSSPKHHGTFRHVMSTPTFFVPPPSAEEIATGLEKEL